MSDEQERAETTDQATSSPEPPSEPPSEAAPTATDTDAAPGAQRVGDQDDIEELLLQAESGIAEAAGDDASQSGASASPFKLGELEASSADGPNQSLDLLDDIELDLRIELGRTMMRLEDVLQLRRGSVVVLDKLAGDPVDIFVNGRLVARGEVLVMNDNFCIRVTELAGSGV